MKTIDEWHYLSIEICTKNEDGTHAVFIPFAARVRTMKRREDGTVDVVYIGKDGVMKIANAKQDWLSFKMPTEKRYVVLKVATIKGYADD